MTNQGKHSHPASSANGGTARKPRWAAALVESFIRLAEPLSIEERRRVRSTAWPILRTALAGLVRQQASQLGPLSSEAMEDIAAEKSLDLMLRCEAGRWSPRDWSGPQLSSFLARVARNGVVDCLRASGPRRIGTSSENGVVPPSFPREATMKNPATLVEAAEYAGHLLEGVRRLKPRARTVWFLRVCFEWPSRRIAAYPGVGMPASHVDVELQRTRLRIRDWMHSGGFDVGEMPPGTFVALWEACLRDGTFARLTFQDDHG